MITMNPFEVLNPQGLADECGVTIARIHQLIRAGTIRATRLGKWTYVISRQEAERFKAERQREARR
jgi:predicted site-specific integrase-resolvase